MTGLALIYLALFFFKKTSRSSNRPHLGTISFVRSFPYYPPRVHLARTPTLPPGSHRPPAVPQSRSSLPLPRSGPSWATTAVRQVPSPSPISSPAKSAHQVFPLLFPVCSAKRSSQTLTSSYLAILCILDPPLMDNVESAPDSPAQAPPSSASSLPKVPFSFLLLLYLLRKEGVLYCYQLISL